MSRPSSKKIDIAQVYLVWIIEDISVKDFHTVLGCLFKGFGFPVKIIAIVKSKDIYQKNFIDTFLFRASRNTVVLHGAHNMSYIECMKLARCFIPENVSLVAVLRNGLLMEPGLFQKLITTFMKDPVNSVLVMKEKDTEDNLIYNPSDNSFVLSNFMLLKSKFFDKIDGKDKEPLNICSLPDTYFKVIGSIREPLFEPGQFNYTDKNTNTGG